MFRNALAFLLMAVPLAGLAQDDDVGLAKFRLNGTTLVYDTMTDVDGAEAEITRGDIDRLLRLLRDNPDIGVLELNSSGGSVYASEEMARVVIDFELDTVVAGSCVSSCVNIFLGGKARRMMLGSKIGFHQRNWSAQAAERYYNDLRESKRWATPFEFVSWVYVDTQTETYQHLAYMVERGVDPGFAIKTKSVSNDDEWYPSRLDLFRAGVLRD